MPSSFLDRLPPEFIALPTGSSWSADWHQYYTKWSKEFNYENFTMIIWLKTGCYACDSAPPGSLKVRPVTYSITISEEALDATMHVADYIVGAMSDVDKKQRKSMYEMHEAVAKILNGTL